MPNTVVRSESSSRPGPESTEIGSKSIGAGSESTTDYRRRTRDSRRRIRPIGDGSDSTGAGSEPIGTGSESTGAGYQSRCGEDRRHRGPRLGSWTRDHTRRAPPAHGVFAALAAARGPLGASRRAGSLQSAICVSLARVTADGRGQGG